MSTVFDLPREKMRVRSHILKISKISKFSFFGIFRSWGKFTIDQVTVHPEVLKLNQLSFRVLILYLRKKTINIQWFFSGNCF